MQARMSVISTFNLKKNPFFEFVHLYAKLGVFLSKSQIIIFRLIGESVPGPRNIV